MTPSIAILLAALPIDLPAEIILGILAIPFIFGSIPFARRFVLVLTAKYLLKRRLAWVSLAAVALCTAMVLIVLSVMGGWLSMFRTSFKTMSGDVIVSGGQRGFGHYEEMIEKIEKLPDVAAAVPIIETAGMLEIVETGYIDYVGVVGLPNDRIERVMQFHDSLWLQHNRPTYEPGATTRPNVGFDLWSDVPYELYSADPAARSRPGMIVGAGAIGVHADRKTGAPDWPESLNLNAVRLSVFPPSNADVGGPINLTTTSYWIVDGSRTQTPTHDRNVYVPFERLQRDLNMTASERERIVSRKGEPIRTVREVMPARTTSIQIKARDGVDINRVRDEVESIVFAVRDAHEGEIRGVKVQTWEQEQGQFLKAVENEIGIVMTLFSLISLVAVFMVFCIFYTIVAEKTRDIGILKAVGASAGSVAQVFLVYGAAIGVVGGVMGIALSAVIVHYINPIHGFLSQVLGRPIYNSEVYAFDKLPDQLNWPAAIVIWVIGIAAAIIGATLPAIRAARMNPVESLRFE